MQSDMALFSSITPGQRSAFEAAEAVIRAHSKTFFLATALLPPAARRAIRSLYGFCRSSDDLVDCTTTSQHELEAWRREVNLPAAHQRNPLLFSWALIREHYSIDRRYESELLDGLTMDLTTSSYATWQDLQLYCYRVASTVGLLSIPIIGCARGSNFKEAAPYAIQLGIALQLTNILRDVGEDARRGRVYLPSEDLAAFGLTQAEISAGVEDERFAALMKFEIARARSLYAAGLPGITLLSLAARPAVGAAALLYEAILTEIEALDYRIQHQRAHTTSWRKLWMLPGILFKIFTLPRP